MKRIRKGDDDQRGTLQDEQQKQKEAEENNNNNNNRTKTKNKKRRLRSAHLAEHVVRVDEGEVDDLDAGVARVEPLERLAEQEEEVGGRQRDQVVSGRRPTEAPGRREHAHGQHVAHDADDDERADAVEVRVVDHIHPGVRRPVARGRLRQTPRVAPRVRVGRSVADEQRRRVGGRHVIRQAAPPVSARIRRVRRDLGLLSH